MKREHRIADAEARRAARAQEHRELQAALKSTEDHLEANRQEMETQVLHPDDDHEERMERLRQERTELEAQRDRERQELADREGRVKCAHDDLKKAKAGR